MRILRLALAQLPYENKAFWRNPAAAFFTFAFPLLFLVIVNLIFGNEEVRLPEGTIHASTFFIPMIIAFAVINASYTKLAMNLTIARDRGILKKIRGTPLPAASFLIGNIVFNTLVSALLVLIMLMVGLLFFDVTLPIKSLPAFLVTLLLGAAAFSSLGLAITTVIPNADAAPAIVNASILPLLFVSDVFIPMDEAPVWLNTLAQFFPVRPLSVALQDAFYPFSTGFGFNTVNLLILTAWLIAGIVLSTRFFSWEPRR